MSLNCVEYPRSLGTPRWSGRHPSLCKTRVETRDFTTRHMPRSKTLLGVQSKFRKLSLSAPTSVETLDVAFKNRAPVPVRSAAVGRAGSKATCYYCGQGRKGGSGSGVERERKEDGE